jgi:hypothetical protein
MHVILNFSVSRNTSVQRSWTVDEDNVKENASMNIWSIKIRDPNWLGQFFENS